MSYGEIRFELEQMPGCCGIGVVNNFVERFRGLFDYTPLPYKTKKEQAEACVDEIKETTWGRRAALDFTDYPYLQINLVSKYANTGEPQFPELQEALIADGWIINMVFVNPAHGNEITVYSKYFPERDHVINTDIEDYEEDDDDY